MAAEDQGRTESAFASDDSPQTDTTHPEETGPLDVTKLRGAHFARPKADEDEDAKDVASDEPMADDEGFANVEADKPEADVDEPPADADEVDADEAEAEESDAGADTAAPDAAPDAAEAEATDTGEQDDPNAVAPAESGASDGLVVSDPTAADEAQPSGTSPTDAPEHATEEDGDATVLMPMAELDDAPASGSDPDVSLDLELDLDLHLGPEQVPEPDFVPMPTVRVPSFDEEHGGTDERYQPDFSRLERAYQPEPEREIRLPHMSDEDGAGYRVPGEGKSRSKARPFLAFLLVAVLVAGIVAAGSYGLELWGGKHLPNVVGLSESQAISELEAKGFAAEVRTTLADDAIGYVLEQNPTAGTRLEQGTKIVLVVATSREMPDVVGLKQTEAEDLLRKAGAENIKVESKPSAEDEGKVLSVSPDVGAGFTAHQTITITVATKTPVPNVVGKNRTEAISAIENAGYVAEATNVTDASKPNNTVIEQDPKPNTKLAPGSTVKIKVAQAKKMDPLHFVEYFAMKPKEIAEYLPKQGFSLNSSRKLEDAGYCEQEYVSTDKGRIIFADRPFSHTYAGTGKEDLLAKDMKYWGIRWELPASMLPKDIASLSAAATDEIIKKCGFTGQKDVCTQDDIKIPSDGKKNDAKFRCTCGEMNGTVWTVLLETKNGTSRAVVTCAPQSYYDEWIDLKPFDGAICDKVAYSDVYTDR